MRDLPQKKHSQNRSSGGVTEEIKVIGLDDLETLVAPLKNAAKIDKDSTPRRERKKKDGNTELRPNDKTTMENTTEKPAGTRIALEISVVEKAPASKTKLGSLVHSGFDDHMGQKLLAACMEPSM